MFVDGRGSTGFGASGGPPARGVTRRFTHFHAAYFHFGVRAVAVAAASGNRAGWAGCVGAKNESRCKEQGSEKDEP